MNRTRATDKIAFIFILFRQQMFAKCRQFQIVILTEVDVEAYRMAGGGCEDVPQQILRPNNT